MTDEQIIKAFEEVAGDNHIPITHQIICCDVLRLINCQKTEIARLKKKNTILSKNADTAFQDGLNENRDLFKKEVEPEIRTEAIKEFAERLKKEALIDSGYEVLQLETIDNLVKEMTEVQE